jgi:hypothetical protein
MKNNTYGRRKTIVSTVKKSQAMIPAACWRRNDRHVVGARRGAGQDRGRAAPAGSSWPTPGRPSATARRGGAGGPHRGFSRASHRPAAPPRRSEVGRGGGRQVQRRTTTRRCQPSSVSGWTRNTGQRPGGSSRLNAASSARSVGCRRAGDAGGAAPPAPGVPPTRPHETSTDEAKQATAHCSPSSSDTRWSRPRPTSGPPRAQLAGGPPQQLRPVAPVGVSPGRGGGRPRRPPPGRPPPAWRGCWRRARRRSWG